MNPTDNLRVSQLKDALRKAICAWLFSLRYRPLGDFYRDHKIGICVPDLIGANTGLSYA
jgi:hypothetical protein